MPPLGNELFDDLFKNGHSQELNKLPDDIKNVFKQDGFEEGMQKCLEMETFDEHKLLREMGKYFLRFYISEEDKEDNLYYLLLKNLSYKPRTMQMAQPIELILSSLNYECLIEDACMKLSNLKNILVIKPHGSANFLPDCAVNNQIYFNSISSFDDNFLSDRMDNQSQIRSF